MMPFVGGGMILWLILVIVLLLLVALGLYFLGAARARDSIGPRRAASPEELLRERYVRGEVGRQAYLDVLADVLKDRYVRGELNSDEYEERVAVLLQPPDRSARAESLPDQPPPPR
jgi:uncharacterized membrane protein